MKNNKMILMES